MKIFAFVLFGMSWGIVAPAYSQDSSQLETPQQAPVNLGMLKKAYDKGRRTLKTLSANLHLAREYYSSSDYKSAVDHYLLYMDEDSLNVLHSADILDLSHAMKSIGQFEDSDDWLKDYKRLTNDSSDFKSSSAVAKELQGRNPNLTLSPLTDLTRTVLFPTSLNQETKELIITSTDDNNKKASVKDPYTKIVVLDVSSHVMRDFSKNLDTAFNESDGVFTSDGESMFYTRNEFSSIRETKRAKQPNNVLIYEARMNDEGEWQNLGPVSFNFRGYFNGHPALSVDERFIYFTSNANHANKMDIYRVPRFEDGSFGQAEALGPEINSPSNEGFPFLTKDALYFSSQGHDNMGGMDLFRAVRVGTAFSKPENLGGVVNSNSDDFSILIDATTQKAYFGSNRAGTDMIYTFNLNDLDVVVQPNPSIPNSKPEVISEEEFSSSNLTLKEIIPYHEQSSSIGDKVLFGYDSFELSEANKAYLDALAKLLNKNENLYLEIRAYTDSRGTKEYNLNLSELRAYAVKSYLIRKDISPQRLEHFGFGESNLLNHCSDDLDCSEAEHAINRRVEYFIAPKSN